MEYEEALAYALTVRWKIVECGTSDCWCRMICPENPVYDKNDNEIYIVSSGSMSKIHAEYIVNLHNEDVYIKSM